MSADLRESRTGVMPAIFIKEGICLAAALEKAFRRRTQALDHQTNGVMLIGIAKKKLSGD